MSTKPSTPQAALYDPVAAALGVYGSRTMPRRAVKGDGFSARSMRRAAAKAAARAPRKAGGAA